MLENGNSLIFTTKLEKSKNEKLICESFLHASFFISSNCNISHHSYTVCRVFEEIHSYFWWKWVGMNVYLIEPCIWSHPVDQNSSCLVNLLYIWPVLAAEVLFSLWLLGSNAHPLLSLLIKTPQRCFITNCLMVSVKVDTFGFSHLKQNVFCHIVWIKRVLFETSHFSFTWCKLFFIFQKCVNPAYRFIFLMV